MKIAILFDGISALGPTPDLAILETVEAIERSLVDDGHDTVRIAIASDGRWIERLRRAKTDLAFNLCEGIDGIATFEPSVVGALDLLGLPYTGSSAWTTALCLRKPVVNALLALAGLPVPRYAVVRTGDAMPNVGFPAICKPAAEDASLGVEQGSVVRTRQALADRVGAMHAQWPEVLVQRFVDGRELNVGIVGDTALPISEIDFARMPRGLWRIVTYRSKWDAGCDEDLGAVPRCPAPLCADMANDVSRIAVAAWRAVGGEGYGRVDLRVDKLGRPWILEVNANPDIAPDAGLARMSRVAGVDYAALIRLICDHALVRPNEPAGDRWAMVERLSGVEREGARRARDAGG